MSTAGALHSSYCLLLLALFIVPSAWSAEPVKVSVYYETLCPDSSRFFVNQLYPVWLDLKDIMTNDINCYGKANDTSVGDGYTFICQHGPDECEGNMMITCAKSYIPDEDKFMAFSNCIMDRFVGTAAGQECAQEAGVTNFSEIEICYTSVEGQQLLHQVGLLQEPLDPQIYYVPWILINDVFTSEQLDAAEIDLRKVVCDAYQGTPPAACSM
ncbi:hypothetical protein Pcinc_021400 [Petrolisthes cinctipes]|uniref:Gamma-interferon-inducible lysosomal thiol reductase n=1 Tax=Petrolisthes cinctipes TaxID=88211 RepID=A0AAE1KJW3_PETCI|nr:hypothetical protein Pcinc_021400 [Petrolisthes cinctipes]